MKNNRRNILFTFDYELFLGVRSGTVKNCLIEPTERLLNIFREHKIENAVFFVDTTYLLQLKQINNVNAKNDLQTIIDQLHRVLQNGHYIFPHIHPHWLDAKYVEETNQFDLSNLEKYSLASLKVEQIEKLFRQSFILFKELGIDQSSWGYRAGGWCIQPFANYKDLFKRYNITHEFSVLPHYKNEKEEQFFDFTKVEKMAPYFFSDDVIEANDHGEFREMPISLCQFSGSTKFYDKIVKKYLWKKGDKGFGDGIGAQTAALKTTIPGSEMITIDSFNRAKLNSYKKFIENNNYMHWISHPKMFTNHGLRIFARFLGHIKNSFEVETDFTKM